MGPPVINAPSLLAGGLDGGEPSKSTSTRADATKECHSGVFTRKPTIVLRGVIVRRPCCPAYVFERTIALLPCPCWKDWVESLVVCACKSPYGVNSNLFGAAGVGSTFGGGAGSAGAPCSALSCSALSDLRSPSSAGALDCADATERSVERARATAQKAIVRWFTGVSRAFRLSRPRQELCLGRAAR